MGAYEVLKRLPVKEVAPSELQKLHEDKDNEEHKKVIYISFIEEE